MSSIPLKKLVYVRSGDKGANANIGVIAQNPDHYKYIEDQLTADHLAELYSDFLEGEVERYELPNLGCLNFVLHQVLDGGGITSLRIDPQGKALCEALLQLEIEIPDDDGENP